MDEDSKYNSDEEISDKKHTELLKAVASLDKSQHVRNPTRTEPTTQISEFNLVKSGIGAHNAIRINDLVKTLTKSKDHAELGKKIKSVRRKTTILPKPLEKPEQKRIQRHLGFEQVKQSLNQWNAVVASNRAAEQLSFPLQKQTRLRMQTSKDLISRFRVKSELEQRLAELEPPKPAEESDEDEFPLTLEEMLERRKEAAKLRVQQSYREAKARRQSKIKSKKFHRIQKRAKMKEQMREFETLQKTNPEEALKKLEEIERARVEERVSLRHRSTGQWARSKQVRAKYDKESRQVLAQQLAVSRDLTQKLVRNDSSESEEEGVPADAKNDKNNSENPWINNVKTGSEVVDFVSGYRKYWNDKNQNTELRKKYNGFQNENNDKEVESSCEEDMESFKKDISCLTEVQNDTSGSHKINGQEVYVVDIPNKTDTSAGKTFEKVSPRKKNKPKSKKIKQISTTIWDVESIPKANDEAGIPLDEIFDKLDDKIQSKLNQKVNQIKKILNRTPKRRRGMQQPTEDVDDTSVSDLTMKKARLRPEIDEALHENDTNATSEIEKLQSIVTARETVVSTSTPDIDPNTFIHITPKHLKTQLPDTITADEALDDVEDADNANTQLTNANEQQALIAEAFEDDDIVEDFRKEKQSAIEAAKPQDIDLSMPGWGSWGGTNVKVNARKQRRFIVKFPEKERRRDDNKGDLIVKEHRDKKVREHQVSDLPFPFTSVAEYEASIRAPLGSSFIPETAHRRLIKPAVVTKMGTVIEPMDEAQLLKREHMNMMKKKKKPIIVKKKLPK